RRATRSPSQASAAGSGDAIRGSSSAGIGETSSGTTSGPRPTRRSSLSTRLKYIELQDALAAQELERRAQARTPEQRPARGEGERRHGVELGRERDRLLGRADDEDGASVEPARDLDAEAPPLLAKGELAVGAEADRAVALQRRLAAGRERQAGEPGAVLRAGVAQAEAVGERDGGVLPRDAGRAQDERAVGIAAEDHAAGAGDGEPALAAREHDRAGA